MTRQISTNHHRLAGVVMEPIVQGAAGILVHPAGYLKHVRDLCTQHNVLMIADDAKPLAMAGIMGGEESGITLETSELFLESAFFAPKSKSCHNGETFIKENYCATKNHTQYRRNPKFRI